MFTLVLIISVLLRVFSSPSTFWIAAWPGTVVHEFFHWLIGLLLLAEPQSFSVLPKEDEDGEQVMGSVSFANVGWWNALPIGVAPLLAIPAVFLACQYASPTWASWQTGLFIWIAASAIAQCWPSPVDWYIAFSNKFGVVFWGFVTYKVLL